MYKASKLISTEIKTQKQRRSRHIILFPFPRRLLLFDQCFCVVIAISGQKRLVLHGPPMKYIEH